MEDKPQPWIASTRYEHVHLRLFVRSCKKIGKKTRTVSEYLDYVVVAITSLDTINAAHLQLASSTPVPGVSCGATAIARGMNKEHVAPPRSAEREQALGTRRSGKV